MAIKNFGNRLPVGEVVVSVRSVCSVIVAATILVAASAGCGRGAGDDPDAGPTVTLFDTATTPAPTFPPPSDPGAAGSDFENSTTTMPNEPSTTTPFEPNLTQPGPGTATTTLPDDWTPTTPAPGLDPAQPTGAVSGQAAIARIDSIEEEWASTTGNSYSYRLRYRTRKQHRGGCDLGDARVVVEDGEVADAAGLPSGNEPPCRIDPSDAPTITDLFEIARSAAADRDLIIDEYPDESAVVIADAEYGDGSLEFSISDVSDSTAPTAIGWDEVRTQARDARARWSSRPFDHVVRILVAAFSENAGERITTVVDGKTVRIVDGGQEVDPATVVEDWPYTVEDVFDAIGRYDGDGYVAAVFDPDTGVPTDLWLDPIPDAVDDEFALTVHVEPV